MKNGLIYLISISIILNFLSASPWNSPYKKEDIEKKTLFTSFSSPPKHLDPVVSYSSNEWVIISQIYEPPLQYNYIKRPYTLEPLTLKSMPEIIYLDKNRDIVDKNSSNIAYTKYIFRLRDDILYQNHPAFLKENWQLKGEIDSIYDLNLSTRKLKASDYIYAIKRMAVRKNNSPILDIMKDYIIGLDEYSKMVSKLSKKDGFDLRDYNISGVELIDDFSFSITINGKYPQFLYWLSMNFFAPIPYEAEKFYNQKVLKRKNITLNTYPIGTGAFYMVENNPNQKMVLLKNQNYHIEYYPNTKERLPFLEQIIFSLEKESIPLWNKFLQGYYDSSGVNSEAFDQTINISANGNMELSEDMKKRGIRLKSSIAPSIYYMAFNMLDPVVGGYSKEAKKLRQAISIAQNEEEYISIFLNGRGVVAQSPIPPEIFGHLEGKEGIDPFVYDYINGKAIRKPIEYAKKLLAEAGYPNGVSKKTGKRLVLYYDTTSSGVDDRALLDWRRKQFKKLGIDLIIRATDYNRFQEKVRLGKVQIFSWGWNADYPDPENFLFLLYGKNGVVKTDGAGVNSANYENREYDRLFEEIRVMENGKERLEKIKKMVRIVQEDAPWVFGIHPKSLILYHSWVKNVIPNAMANNVLKYRDINVTDRIKKQEEWNRPVIYPLFIGLGAITLLVFLLVLYYKKRESYKIK
jgi:ABC-type transport system substrate-binding protein